MINTIMFIVGLFAIIGLVIELISYIHYLINTGESYKAYKRDEKLRKQELKTRKKIRQMLTDVYNMSEEELQKKKDEYAKKYF